MTQDFKTNIIDGTSNQDLLLVFDGAQFLSYYDGDFTEDDIEINNSICAEDNILFGGGVSSDISFTILNERMDASTMAFGWAKAFIGVVVQTTSKSGNFNAYVKIGNDEWTGRSDGLYKNGTRLFETEFPVISLYAKGGYIWAYSSSVTNIVRISNDTYQTVQISDFMRGKFTSYISFYFDGTFGYRWDGANVYKYEYCPVGVFNISKPERLKEYEVGFSTAQDKMTKFDRSATEFINTLSTTLTIKSFVDSLCSYCGTTFALSSFPHSTDTFNKSILVENEYTCRDLLKFAAEYCGTFAYCTGDGLVSFKSLQTSTVEEITYDRLELDGEEFAEYETENITKLIIQSSEGSSLTFGSGDNAYTVYGNPFITGSSWFDRPSSIPNYIPITASIITADPSIECGDKILFNLSQEETMALMYGDGLSVDANNLAFYFVQAAIKRGVPLISRTIVFNGQTSAVYQSNGDKVRPYDSAAQNNYAISVSNGRVNGKVAELDNSFDQQKVFNRLTNGGQSQGIYIDPATNKIYINGAYIKGETIVGQAINNGNGTFSVDPNGNVVANSLTSTNASITGGKVNINSAENSIIEVSRGNQITQGGQTKHQYESLMYGHGFKVTKRIDSVIANNELGFFGCYVPLAHQTYAGGVALVMYPGNAGETSSIEITSKGNIYSKYAPTQSSDRRLKHDIKPINVSNLQELNPVSFKLNGDESTHYGLIAQEVQETSFRDIVEGDKDGMLSIPYTEFIAFLVKGWQEHEKRIAELESMFKGDTK